MEASLYPHNIALLAVADVASQEFWQHSLSVPS